IAPLIIVGIYNTGEQRADEYTPTRVEKLKAGGRADLYGRLIVEELRPFIGAHYRTLGGPENTALGGASLGGLVTLYLGLRYPNVFGKLAVMSPSVWWDNGVILREVEKLPGPTPQRIWLDAGTKEGGMVTHNARLLRDALVARGWRPGPDLKYIEARGATHDEAAWGKRFDKVLKYLFPRYLNSPAVTKLLLMLTSKITIRLGAFCLLLPAISFLSFAQEPAPQPLRIDQAVGQALDNYPAVRAAQAQARAAEAGVEVARTAYLPRADLLWQENRASRNNVFGLLLPQSV